LAAALRLAPALQFLSRIAQTDTRYTMAAWIAATLPRGALVHLNAPYNVPLDPAWFTVTQNFGGQYRTIHEVIASGVQYVVIGDSWRFDQARQRGIVGEAVLQELDRYYADWEARLIPLAHIDRPRWIGEDEPPPTASIWHHPGMTVYAVMPP